MTATEIRAYQTSFPLQYSTNKMRYVPRAYREGNIPYEGVKNHIPLERMKDPETGDFYPLDDIKVNSKVPLLKQSLRFFRNIKQRNILKKTKEFDVKDFMEISVLVMRMDTLLYEIQNSFMKSDTI